MNHSGDLYSFCPLYSATWEGSSLVFITLSHGFAQPNDDRCFIDVDGQRYSWRDGESVVFDETYIHYAENTTDQNRIIFFADVERPLKTRFMQKFNHWFGKKS